MRASVAMVVAVGLIAATGGGSAAAHVFTNGPVGSHDPAFVNCTDHMNITYNAAPAAGYSSQYIAARDYHYWWNGSTWIGRGWSDWDVALVHAPPAVIINWGRRAFGPGGGGSEPNGYHYFFTSYAWYNPTSRVWDGTDGVWSTTGWYGGNRSDYCYLQEH